jgi:hypothetical protein
MFVQELDIFDEINLVYILEQYYSLEAVLRARVKREQIFTREDFENDDSKNVYCVIRFNPISRKIISINIPTSKGSTGLIWMYIYDVNENSIILDGNRFAEIFKARPNEIIIRDLLKEFSDFVIKGPGRRI